MSELGLGEQRDRFLAFAFAASDVLIEIDGDGVVGFVTGSVRSLFAHSTEEMMGIPILECAMSDNRVAFSEFIENLKLSGRASDTLIDLNGGGGKVHTAVVSGMASPQRTGIYHLAFRKAPFMLRVAHASRKKKPVTADEHAASVAKTAEAAKQNGELLNFAMFDVDLDGAEEQGLSGRECKELSSSLVETIQAWSADGQVGEISKGKFSVLLEDGVDVSKVKRRMTEVAKTTTPQVDLGISESAISFNDLVDTDDFAGMLEDAMQHFDEVGGEMFDLTAVEETRNAREAARRAEEAAQAQRPARRRGVTESWG